jgi:hypothetical protein
MIVPQNSQVTGIRVVCNTLATHNKNKGASKKA